MNPFHIMRRSGKGKSATILVIVIGAADQYFVSPSTRVTTTSLALSVRQAAPMQIPVPGLGLVVLVTGGFVLVVRLVRVAFVDVVDVGTMTSIVAGLVPEAVTVVEVDVADPEVTVVVV